MEAGHEDAVPPLGGGGRDGGTGGTMADGLSQWRKTRGSYSVATAAPTAALTTEEVAATVAAVDAIVQRQGQIVHTLLLE